MTVTFVGAKGGVGTSTIAATSALLLSRKRPTVLEAVDPAEMAALLGSIYREPQGEILPDLFLQPLGYEIMPIGPVVRDIGTLDAQIWRGEAQDSKLVIVTTTCYLALRRIIEVGATVAGALVQFDKERSLSPKDVADTTGLPILGTIERQSGIARAVDSGVLSTRVPSELRRAVGFVLAAEGVSSDA